MGSTRHLWQAAVAALVATSLIAGPAIARDHGDRGNSNNGSNNNSSNNNGGGGREPDVRCRSKSASRVS